MASERALLEVNIIPDGINLVAMGPEADVLDCLAKVAVAWLSAQKPNDCSAKLAADVTEIRSEMERVSVTGFPSDWARP